MEKIIVTLWITFGIYLMVLLAIMADLWSGVRKAKKKLTEITRQEILNQVEKQLVELGKQYVITS